MADEPTDIPAPDEPGAPGLQILDTDPEKALMRDPKVDPRLADLMENATAFEPVPDLTPDEIVGVVAHAIGFEVFKADGREVKPNADGVDSIVTTAEEDATALRAAERALLHLDAVRHPFEDIRRLQREQAEWSARNFTPVDPPGHIAAMGLGEEGGEMGEAIALSLTEAFLGFRLQGIIGRALHAQLKGEQSIRYTPEEIRAKKADAAGDIVIYLADFCTMNGLDLGDILRDVWGEVIQRNWADNPLNAAQIVKAGLPEPQVGETGTVFEPGMAVVCTQDTTYRLPDTGSSTFSEGINRNEMLIEPGDKGIITSVSPDGVILVRWDDDPDGQDREVLHLDIEPVGTTVEPERPAVVHYDAEGQAHDDGPPEVASLHESLGTSDSEQDS